jgi:uncharacterized protein (UPF0332 family)
MLDEKRAKANVNNYLSEGLLKKEPFREIVFKTYIKNHDESLKLADDLFKTDRSKLWIIVISYYSMFYIANAVLYKMGYKVGDKIAHKITLDALITYVKNKLKASLLESYKYASEEALAISDNLLQNYNYELAKRAKFQYESTEEIKFNQAKTSLERAKEFATEMERLLNKMR